MVKYRRVFVNKAGTSALQFENKLVNQGYDATMYSNLERGEFFVQGNKAGTTIALVFTDRNHQGEYEPSRAGGYTEYIVEKEF